MGTCRYVYNFYLAHNLEIYEKEKRFVSGMEFQKWLNNELIPNNIEYKWMKEVSSKSVKKSIMNADGAFRRFFKHQSGFPKFKKKGSQM
ncbi:MAG: helix-turn-helix domain-containing protein [Lachnospiraceae bacterium]|nr:helix-turn-helix domain-containing protein [Lachnospiraceae bacterium]